MQMKKSEVAVSGPLLAIESVPFRCLRPVDEVRSSGIAGYLAVPLDGLAPP